MTRPTTSTASASKARRSKWTAMPALVSPSRTTSMLASMGQLMASSVKPSSASSVTWPVATGAAVTAHRRHDEGCESPRPLSQTTAALTTAGLLLMPRLPQVIATRAPAASAVSFREGIQGCVRGGGDIGEPRHIGVAQRHRHHRGQRLVLELRQRDGGEGRARRVQGHGGTIHQSGAGQNAALPVNGAAPAGARSCGARAGLGRRARLDGGPCASRPARARRRWWRSADPAPEPLGRSRRRWGRGRTRAAPRSGFVARPHRRGSQPSSPSPCRARPVRPSPDECRPPPLLWPRAHPSPRDRGR